MQDEHKFVLLLARLVDLLGQGQPARDECMTALQHLVDFTNRRSGTVRLSDNSLSVEGYAAPRDVPFVRTFMQRLQNHRVAELRFAQGAAAVDILELAQTLSTAPADGTFAEQLVSRGILSVTSIDQEAFDRLQGRRAISVAQAIDGAGADADATPPASGPPAIHAPAGKGGRSTGPKPRPSDGSRPDIDFVPAREGAAYGQMVELTQASSTTLAAAVHRLRGSPDGPELSKGLNAVALGVVEAVRDQRVPEAVDAVIAVIKQEEEEHRDDVRLRYGVALRRILQPEVLEPLLELLLDPIFAEDIATIMRRAGTRGTELLLDHLIQAPTFAERRAFMEALGKIGTGTDLVVGMLDHHEWFVVRNVADLVGELRIEEGVPGLGEAVRHPDRRVRLSAGLALAKIGTPAAVKHLGAVLRDEDDAVRLKVAQAVSGKGLGALAMPLVNAVEREEDEDVRDELYRALGRIGSNDAVTALIKASEPGGLVIGRRPARDRIAATQGLVAAGGERARKALEKLARDRDRTVRGIAHDGLREMEQRGA